MTQGPDLSKNPDRDDNSGVPEPEPTRAYEQPPADPTAYAPPPQDPYAQDPYAQQGQPGYGQPAYGQPQPGYPPAGQPQPAYGYAGVPDPSAPYGRHPVTGMPFSDKSKLAAGLLQILIPLGIGRMYMGDVGIGVAQLLVTIFTCGFGFLWPFIDGIMILVGEPTDGEGRPLRQ